MRVRPRRLAARAAPWLAAFALALAALALAATRQAAAQSCHAPAGTSASEGPSASLALREATVDAGGPSADYQGVLLGVGYALAPLEATAVLPAYRLDAGAGTQLGLGDLLLDLRATLLGGYHDHADHRDHLQVGLELASTLPTGRASTGLGMGHVMLMPGLFARVHDARAAIVVQAGYGRALSDDAHQAAGDEHAHAGAAAAAGHRGSIVDPMSASELEAALTLYVRLTRRYALLGSLAAAAPIATEGGRARAALGAGGSASLGPVALSLLVELPLTGDPFTQRATATATWSP